MFEIYKTYSTCDVCEKPGYDLVRLAGAIGEEMVVGHRTCAPNACVRPDRVLSSYQDPTDRQWWRIRRETGTGIDLLESISERSLDRGLCWAYACEIDSMLGTGPTGPRALETLRAAIAAYLKTPNGAICDRVVVP